MAKSLTGSINLTKLSKLFKAGHSSFWKSRVGDDWANIEVYIKDQPDQYGNHASVSITPSKKAKESGEQLAFIGNVKWYERSTDPGLAPNVPFTDGDSRASTKDDDHPF